MRVNWLASLLVGAGAALLLGTWPSLGFALLLAFVIPAGISRHRQAAITGMLAGLAGTWLSLVSSANAKCAEFDAAPNQGCEAPDLTGWMILAAGLLIAGLVGSLDLLRRRRQGR